MLGSAAAAHAIVESQRVSGGNDDAEERTSNGSMYRTSTDLEFAYDGGTRQIIGMRFVTMNIPPGATINSAYIDFETDETDSGTTNLVIYGQDSDDANGFGSSNYDISSRPKTSASISWSPGPWNTVNQNHQTPDLSSIVQEIIDRSGWSSGNDIVIVVEPGSGCSSSSCQRTAESYNGESTNAPLLVVDYTPGASGVETEQVSSGNDDAEERVSDGHMYLNSSDLELSYDSYHGGLQSVGMRFRTIYVPPGANISSAYVEFETDETDSGTTNLVIYGQGSDTANAFTSAANNISSRPKTSASVSWSPGAWNTVNQNHQSPDISTIIQEIIDRPGWSSGNDMAIIVEPGAGCSSSSCQRTAESYDGEPANAPRLVINYAAASIDHFAITHGGSAINCLAEPITLTAHQADHTVVTDYTGSINLSTSTNHGDWTVQTGNGTMTGGPGDDGAASYTFAAGDNGVVVLLLKNPHAELLNIDAVEGGHSEDPSEDADLNFAAAGFRFIDAADLEQIGTQISGKPSNDNPGSQTLYLQGIDTDVSSGDCVDLFAAGQDVAIDLGAECKNPATCDGEQVQLSNNSNNYNLATSADNSASGATAYTPSPLRFGSDAKAALILNYPDAGQMQLHARYEILLQDGTPSGAYLTGSSNDFVVRPFAFLLDFSGDRTAVDICSGSTSYAANANGSVFATAGEDITLTLTAVAWQSADDTNNDGIPDATDGDSNGIYETCADLSNNSITGNFGKNATAAPADVNMASTLAAPSGGDSGTLSVSSNGASFSNGVGTKDLSWDEVGIIHLAATLDYLGSGAVVPGGAYNVGRFKPHHFTISANTPAFGHGCLSGPLNFTYLGQEFDFLVDPTLTVTAVNSAGGTTNNYGGSFWKLSSTLGGRSYADAAGTGLAVSMATTGAVNLSDEADYDGDGVLTITGDELSYAKPGTALAPFASSVDLDFPAADLTDSDSVCYDVSPFGSCDPYQIASIGSTQLRYGRLVLANAYGPELLNLPTPFIAEFFDGSAFSLNSDDGCTALTTVNHLQLSTDGGSTWVSGETAMTLGSGSTSATLTSSPLNSGDAGLSFSAPGDGNTGTIEVRSSIATDFPWLLFDWDSNGTADNETAGRATFGIFRGNNRLIYMRESFQ